MSFVPPLMQKPSASALPSDALSLPSAPGVTAVGISPMKPDSIERSEADGVHDLRSAVAHVAATDSYSLVAGAELAKGLPNSPKHRDSAREDLQSTASTVKDATIGIDAHRIVPHRYEVRSIAAKVNPETGKARNTSIAGVFDAKANVNSKTGVARGQFEVRFDRSHGYGGVPVGPHLNFGAGEHRAVRVPSAVIEVAGKTARALEGLDRVAVPIGVAIDSVRLGSAFHADGGAIGKQTVRTAGSVAGGWAGGFAGAAAGAELGSAIGLAGGPVGAAIGGVAGGLIGGVAGSFGVSVIGGQLAERLEQ